MAYVGGDFQHDIFISYGRAARRGVESPLKTWSLAFAKELRQHLMLPSSFANLEIYFDEDDGRLGIADLEDHLRRAAESSALLLTLMSDDYLASPWCSKELAWWDAQQKKNSFLNDERVVIVRIQPTMESKWPARLSPIRGYFFHPPQNAPDEIVLPFGYPVPNPKIQGDLPEPFIALGKVLWKQLQTINKAVAERALTREKQAALGNPKPMVYLHGRADQADIWNDSYEKLTNDKFVVVPTQPDPIVGDPVQEQKLYDDRLNTMRDCDALLVLGTPNDSAFDADLTYVSRRARRSLESRGTPLLPCALLDKVGPRNPSKNRKLVADGLGVAWIEAHEEPWTQRVRAWLQSLAGPPPVTR
jgi:hypothetical protein